MLGKHWSGCPHLKRECGASLNARELTREKKVDMGENLQPKHWANRQFSTSKIRVCRFEGGLKVASLKSLVSIVWDANTEIESVAYLWTRENTRDSYDSLRVRAIGQAIGQVIGSRAWSRKALTMYLSSLYQVSPLFLYARTSISM